MNNNSNTQTTISNVQQAYMTAKARYDSLCTELAELMGEAPETEEEIDRYIEEEAEICKALGISEAYDALHQAEDALIAWGHEVAIQDRRYQAYATQLERLFKAVTTNIVYRCKVIDLCLRLDANSVK